MLHKYRTPEQVCIVEKMSKTEIALDQHRRDRKNLHLTTTMIFLLLTVMGQRRQAYTYQCLVYKLSGIFRVNACVVVRILQVRL